ncbi:DUF4395 family protein [Hydrogenimonas sp.]
MASCPISNERVNERIARLVGGLVLLVALLYIARPSLLWLVLLLADFSARSFYRPASLFAQAARPLSERLGAPQIVDAAPKIFAARIGLGMSLAALGLHLVGSVEASRGVLGVMAFCAFFEAAFGYCVGCKFYTLWRKVGGR